MSESTATFKELEKAGSYLFHGTSNGEIVEFEPRQAMSHGQKDGEPCVAASEHLDPAIFMAIFSGRVSCGWDSNGTSFGFYLGKSDFEKAKQEDWKGYVYAFDRSSFNVYGSWEWRSHKNVRPVQKAEVSFDDLPKDIDLR
jgi:hypothetical protein